MLSIKILAKSLHLYFYPSIFPIIVEEKTIFVIPLVSLNNCKKTR